MKASRPTPLLGPEPWKTVRGIPFTTWDLWLLTLAIAGDESGLDGVATKLRERSRTQHGSARDDSEAKLSQLDDLRERLAKLKMTPKDPVLKEARDQRFVTKARKKLLEQTVPERDYTDAMRETPRRRLERRARSGYWPKFPVSPEPYAVELLSIVEEYRYYNESQGIRLAERLDARFDKLAKRVGRNIPKSLALNRAMLFACLAAQERADDSSGEVGMVFTSAIKRYAALDWELTGIDVEVYIRDAVEFSVWEDYGQDEELEALFRNLDQKHGELALSIFDETVGELERYGLFDHQVSGALGFRSVLLIAHRRFDDFVPLATKIGSSAWRPIVTMAEAAMRAMKPDLALAVFGAANQPGMQREYLAKECVRVTGKTMPSPGLRLVK